MPRQRLDLLMVERGLAGSRSRAQALIASGVVQVDGKTIDKPSLSLAENADIILTSNPIPYVSRGALKLAHALDHFGLDVTGMVAADIGASTGGFTEVLLQNGAARIYAVDVGQGQLAESLFHHPQVISLDQTNARYLTRAQIPDPLDIITCDASFISLKTVLPAAMALTKSKATLIALIKPQFEVGKAGLGKGGVVKNDDKHREICQNTTNWLNGCSGWKTHGITPSPIKGPKGNTEFLIMGERDG